MAALFMALCVAIRCVIEGLFSFESLLGGICVALYVIVPVAAIIAGIKYGTQKKDYWA